MLHADAPEAQASEIAVGKFDGLRTAAAAPAVHPTVAMTGGRRVTGGGKGPGPGAGVLCRSTNPQVVAAFTFQSRWPTWLRVGAGWPQHPGVGDAVAQRHIRPALPKGSAAYSRTEI
jgi:hypothetical protein